MSTGTSAPAPAPTPITGRIRTIALVAVLLAAFMDLLDVTIMNVTLPSIRAELGASPAQLQWMLAGFSLMFALGIITGARLGDLYGYKRMFLAGLVGFTVASALCGMAPSADLLIAGRVVQALFAAAMVPQVLSQIQLLYAPHERGGAMAAFSSLSGLAAAAGPIIGAALLTADWFGLGWRLVFWLNVPVGVLTLLLATKVLPEGRAQERPRLDLPGMLVSAVGLLLILYPLIAGGEQRTWPAWTYVSLAAGVAVLLGFHRYQRRLSECGRFPLIEVSLFRERSVGVGLFVQFLFFLPISGYFMTYMQLLQSGLGMSPMTAGVASLAWPVATTAGAAAGTIVLLPRLGRATVQLGLASVALGFVLLAIVAASATPDTGWWAFVPGVFFGGLGMGLGLAPLGQLTLEKIPTAHAGSGSGLFNTVAQLSASVGVAIIGTLFFTQAAVRGFAGAFAVTMWVSLALLAVAFAASFLLPRARVDGSLVERSSGDG